MENLEKILNKYILLIMVILFIPACWALFIPGFYGASDDIHIAWLFEMHKIIFSGQIPPRFVPDLSFGFGYPLFNFIFPLPFYLAEIFHVLGLGLVDSIKALFFITIPVSFLAMYFLLRQFSSKQASLAGAFLYVYTPYRALDLYIRGALGEIVGFMFLPVILLSIIKLENSKGFRWIGIGAIATAFLVLSHNITAYMFMTFAGLFFLLQFFTTEKKFQFLIKSFLMIFLGLLISIYFWLPAIVESSLMKYDTVFNFSDHYPTIKQLLIPYWGYGASVPGPYDGMSFFLGTINILVLILGIILTIIFWPKLEKKIKVLLAWVYICLILVFFLMNYRSVFLWNSLPLLPYFQFPWRFLIMTTFLMPLLLVLLDKIKFKWAAFFIISLTLLTTYSYFRPQDFLGRTDSYFLNRYIPTPLASPEYFQTQEEYLRLSKNTEKRPDRNYPLVTSDNGQIKKVIKINDLDSIILIEADRQVLINYNKYFFPGWIAKIDGQDAKIEIGKPFGQILVWVPEGSHRVEIAFKETGFKMMLNAVSLISFLVSLGLIKNFWPQAIKLASK